MYLVFGGDNYYPMGGMEDYIGRANSLEDAMACGRDSGCDWWHVVDLATLEIVFNG